jgi:hypothetical protein
MNWIIQLFQKYLFPTYVALGIPLLMTDNSSILSSFKISNMKESFVLILLTTINFNFYDSFTLQISAHKNSALCANKLFLS